MATTMPWHSEKAEVHHNNTQCTAGNRATFDPQDLRIGRGDKPLCPACADLNHPGRRPLS